jgi:DNA repair exonuclease SbcCD nuclease subunit
MTDVKNKQYDTDEISGIADSEGVDAVIVAGDLFDPASQTIRKSFFVEEQK